jgi:hypothetical protein
MMSVAQVKEAIETDGTVIADKAVVVEAYAQLLSEAQSRAAALRAAVRAYLRAEHEVIDPEEAIGTWQWDAPVCQLAAALLDSKVSV